MNSVFDKPVEVEVQELSEGIAIVIDGDTAPRAIASGQFLYIKNHSTLPTGGYNATAAIASGDTISSSNVIIDADGIANAIKGNIDTLNSKIVKSKTEFYATYPNGHLYNQTHFFISCPYWNPDFGAVTINNAYVYGPSGSFSDIKSSVTVENVSRGTVLFKITYDSTHEGKLLRIEYDIA